MKRYHELKFGKEGGKSYESVARRGKLEPDFSFIEKGGNPKAVLIYSNQEPKKVKAKEDLNSIQQAKKMKLNNSVSSDKNKENIFSHTNDEFEKLKVEKATLEAKLKYIEGLVMNSYDKDDTTIVKNIRDYLGIIFQTSKIFDKENIQHEESLIDGDFVTRPPIGDDVIILVEGESI